LVQQQKEIQTQGDRRGVESIARGTALLQMDCKLAQGYGIAGPMPADQVPEWVTAWQPDATSFAMK
jgi:EAL domain-containing protein (putative c-di-GMP-specific phosphodiesterase class I)